MDKRSASTISPADGSMQVAAAQIRNTGWGRDQRAFQDNSDRRIARNQPPG
ncbi:hypothetical protein [uncultured Lamprocystis sp.]|uniref:hypothetical protein n=1 Tax=uncultured Lamprocystis sp. TaxID=543132 RepID=UPI0025E457F4|nr:hypothetical protein [uncultured Lamprocystis sp.]